MIAPWKIEIDGWSPSKRQVDALLRVALDRVCCDHGELREAVEGEIVSVVSVRREGGALAKLDERQARHLKVTSLHALIFAIIRDYLVTLRDDSGKLQWRCRLPDADKLRARLVSEYRGPE